MNIVKAQPDVVGVLLGMVGGLLIICPVIPGLAIDYDKLLSNPLAFCGMIAATVSVGKIVRYFMSTGARIVAVLGIVTGWHLLYNTLFSHSLRF
jgi:hypothetical protein